MLNISNYYERLVIDRLWKLTEQADTPLSPGMQEDVACLALNKLPPCYMRNAIDKGINVGDQQFQEMTKAVEVAVEQAMRQVVLRPREHRDD